MANNNNRLVVAYFINADAAEGTAEDLKQWDKANDDVKLGAIAILTLDPNTGEIKADEVGERATKSGALWGTAIGGVVGILTAGIGLIPALILGAGAGGALGALNHKSVGLTDEDRENIVNHLRNGGAALAVMADDFEVDATLAKMVELGGKAESYTVPNETVSALSEAAELQTRAVEAVDTAVDTTVSAVTDVAAAGVGAAGAAVTAAAALASGLDISEADATRLHDAGVAKASAFYKLGATPQGRAELAERTGLSAAAVLVMEKKLDLMRVKGVGPKYATLLVAAGVDSVAELAGRNPANLLAKMSELNAVQQIVAALPSEADVAGWVAAAKDLPKVVAL